MNNPDDTAIIAAIIAAEKKELRKTAISRRATANPALGAALAKHVMQTCPPPHTAVIAGFWPLPNEIDIFPLLHTIAATGAKLCLPVTPTRGNPLTFNTWQPGDTLTPGRFGTNHPTGAQVTPTFILTPLLAFDRAGNRLGYGAGYYDRTFAAIPQAFRLGCAFANQELPGVPHSPTDIPLHAIATEHGIIHAA